MDADLNSILVGYRGKVAMLKSCFGSSEEGEEPTPRNKALDFKSFASAHNAAFANKRT